MNPVVFSADFKAEYLAGQPIWIWLTVTNPGEEVQEAVDLAQRPWRVHFRISGETIQSRTTQTTAPETDPGGVWKLSARGMRQVLLEVPTSAALVPGTYSMTVEVQGQVEAHTLGPASFRVAPPAALGGDLACDPLGIEHLGLPTVWSQQSAQGVELYLHHASGQNPMESLGSYSLASLPAEASTPILSLARPMDGWGRYVYWQEDARSVSYLRLEGQGRSSAVDRVSLPYPKVEFLARGSTAASGDLHVPIWIPNPSGSGGEVRVVTVRDQRQSLLRSVARLDRRPRSVGSVVDSAGALRMVLDLGEAVDVYTIPIEGDLPATGVRILEDAAALRFFRFDYLPDQNDVAGGLALLMVEEESRERDDGEVDRVLVGRWMSLSGTPLHTFEDLPWSEGTPVDLIGEGYEGYLLLLETDPAGTYLDLRPGRAPAPISAFPAARLCTDLSGRHWVRAIAREGGPIRAKQLAP